jgi:hypothetical protein
MLLIPTQLALAAPPDQAQNDKNNNKKPDKKPKDLDSGVFDGRFLDLNYSLAEDKLEDVAFYDVRLFNETYIENGTFTDQKVLNNLFKGDSTNASIKGHDNPLCLIQIKAREDITVHLNLTSNFTIKLESESEITLHNESMDVSIRLLGKPGSEILKIKGLNITIYLPARSKMHINVVELLEEGQKSESPGIFWFSVNSPTVLTGVDGEYYGGDATITGGSNSPVVETYTYLDEFVLDVEQIDTENHEVAFRVSSPEPEGKLVMISSLKAPLGISDETETEVEVYLNGELIQPVNSPNALRQGTAGYYQAADSDGEQILISVPHFSENELMIRFVSRDDIIEKVLTYWDIIAIISILIVVILAGINLYVVRRKNDL